MSYKILKNASVGGRKITPANIEIICNRQMIETLINKKIIKRGKDEQAETGSTGNKKDNSK